jgi:hypothetical protein
MVDGASAVDGGREHGSVGAKVGETDAVAVDAGEEEEETGEFEQGLAFGDGGGAELEGGRVFENEEHGDLAFLDEFFAVGFAEAGGDVPVDIADIVAVGVFDDLVELHASSAESGAIASAEGGFDGVTHAPLKAPQRREGGGRGRN